jgi:hypothetical protein
VQVPLSADSLARESLRLPGAKRPATYPNACPAPSAPPHIRTLARRQAPRHISEPMAGSPLKRQRKLGVRAEERQLATPASITPTAYLGNFRAAQERNSSAPPTASKRCQKRTVALSSMSARDIADAAAGARDPPLWRVKP